MSIVVHWCRATCLGVPCGPWRFGYGGARRDLIARDLGSYDEYGCFYTTVPGGMEVRSERVSLEEAAALARTVKGNHAAEHRKRLAVANGDRGMHRIRGSRLKSRGVSLELLERGFSVAIQHDEQASGE